MNKVAIVFWTFCTLVGYLIGDTHGAAIGLAAGLGISLAVEFI